MEDTKKLLHNRKKVLLCLVPANIDELVTKGVVKDILQRDLNGYWDKVITVHPFAHITQVVELNERHVVYEYKYPTLSMLWSLVRLVKKEKVGAIKAHDPYLMGMLALLLSKICHIPYEIIILSSYQLEWENIRLTILWFHWLDKIVAWITFKFASVVVGANDDCAEWAVRNGAKRSKRRVIRITVSERHYLPLDTRHDLRAELGLVERNIILYVGRLSQEKFVEDVIDCIALLDDSCIMLLAGDGDHRQELEDKVHSYNIADRVRFLGFQPQEKVADLMFTSDVIVSPLTGSSLVEAALSSSPVVAYDIDWQKELIINECTGLVVPWRDTLAMAKAVKRLLEDRALGQRLGMNARNKALEQHGLENMYRQEVALFTNLLGQKSEN